MKNLLIGGLILASTPFAFGAASDSGSPAVNVTVTSESKELAAGFAQAFTRLRHVPFHVQLQREGKTILINDIRTVTAASAVLLLETGKGLLYVVNPKDVVWFSDTPLVVEKPTAAEAK